MFAIAKHRLVLRVVCAAVGAAALVTATVTTVPGRDLEAQELSSISLRSAAVATDIVTGHVLDTTSVVFPSGSPHWVTEVEVTSTRKGDASGTILVEVDGGYVNGYYMDSGAPELRAGDVVELALIAAPADEHNVMVVAMSEVTATSTYAIVGGAQGMSITSSPEASADAAVSGDQGTSLNALPFDPTVSAARGDYVLLRNRQGEAGSWADASQPVPYKINPAGSGLPAEDTIAAIRSAFDTWQDEPASSIRFRYEGTTDRSGFAEDSLIVVSFIATPNLADTFVALTQHIFTQDERAEFVSADIIFNTDYQWSTGSTGALGRFDLESLALHEVGHAIGIAHTRTVDSARGQEVMYPVVFSNSLLRHLGPGDTQAVRALYWQRRECNGRAISVDIGIGEAPTNGDDVILGTGASDLIDGLDGDDVICGARGDDRISGGDGNDELRGHDGDDVLLGGEGDDFIVGGAGKDRGRGQNGNDVLHGGQGNDNLNGNNGDDVVLGQDGHDYVSGKDGDDTVNGGPGTDTINGGSGHDLLIGGPGSDTMSGNAVADQVIGGDGDDIMSGGDGPDRLQGDFGSDRIDGNRGNDTMFGGAGQDLCDGRSGYDSAWGCESEQNVP